MWRSRGRLTPPRLWTSRAAATIALARAGAGATSCLPSGEVHDLTQPWLGRGSADPRIKSLRCGWLPGVEMDVEDLDHVGASGHDRVVVDLVARVA